MTYLKAEHKDGYEEKYAIIGNRFYWLHNGSWEMGSTNWEEMKDNILLAGGTIVVWQPTKEEERKLENR